MAMEMVTSLLGLFLLMFLLLLLLFILACRPWRFFSSRHSSIKSDDLERPLFSENLDHVPGRRSDLTRSFVEESSIQIDGNTSPPRIHALASKKRVHSTVYHANQGDNLVLDVISDTSEDLRISHTVKRTTVASWPVEDTNLPRKEDANYDVKFIGDHGRNRVSAVKGSSLTLEVIAGPSCGLRCSRQSTDTFMLPLTLGRVSPSDLLLNDSEVSGKHALINWNINKSKWELVDMGSLNGTLLNSRAVHHPDSGSRRWSNPVDLASGDIITLGTSSKVSVEIMPHIELQIPFAVGMASDPMAMRRGGKSLPMEDMCYCQWPLPGVEQFGLFGIFDGHSGAEAAKTASRILPEKIANILSNSEKREKVLSVCDASDVLIDAFSLTEAAMNHQYEGCTATVLLVWCDHNKEFFAQCANVGDSACVMNIEGKQINMTEDHRITSLPERTRLSETGKPLNDGARRLYGLNLCRMLGDKFVKEQDARFISVPYVSQIVHIKKTSRSFALLASDGLWDVISIKKAVQLVLQRKERENANNENSAKRIADFVLSEARTLRTKDNTSIIFLDFDTLHEDSCIISS